MGEPSDRRVKLLSDVVYLKTDQGVILRNSEGSFTIAGKHAFQLIHWLASRLDGHQPLEPLLASQPTSLQMPLRQLAQTLIERRFARVLQEEPAVLSVGLAEHAQQIDYLEHLVDRPHAAFARFQGKRALCIGHGVLQRNVEQALREYGLRTIVIVDALTDQVPQADIAFLTNDSRNADAAAARRALRDRAIPFFELGRVAQYAFVHAAGPGTAALCRHCLDAALKDAPCDVDWVAPAAAAMAAHHAAFHALRYLAAEQALPSGLLLIEQPSLISGTKPLPLAMECPRHGGWRLGDRVTRVRPQGWRRDRPFAHDPPEEVSALEAINQCANRLTDSLLGPLHALGEDDLDQIPLGASSAMVRTAGDQGPARIVTHALTAREARNQAVLAALEVSLEHAPHTLSDWSVGAGWSEQEALFRAVRLRLRDACAQISSETFERCRLERCAAETPTVDYLVGALALERMQLRAGLHELHAGIHLARLFDGDLWTGAWGLGASPVHAVANMLLDAVAAKATLTTPKTRRISGLLFLELSADTIAQFTQAAMSAFDVRRAVVTLPNDMAVTPVFLALREHNGPAR